MILVTHELAFTPLSQTIFIVLFPVASEIVLEATNIFNSEIVLIEFKIDKRMILMKTVHKLSTEPFVEAIIIQI